MRILHIVENFSKLGGGVKTVVKNLHNELLNLKFDSEIVSSKKEIEDDVFLVNVNKSLWLYSKNWQSKIEEIHKEKKIDCIHIHGVWMYPQYIAAKFAVKNSIPFILSPHGMYEPWLWIKGTLKKKLYFNLIVQSYFKKASCIHAITSYEKSNLQKLFPQNTVVEIPNLIKDNVYLIEKKLIKDNYILYIGRLDKIKGIDILINAFLELNQQKFTLKIAGEFNDYKESLEELIKNSNIENYNIEFVGFVSGEVKQELISKAFVVVTPSHSEVIGMVNLEAAILKTPVITTYQTGLNSNWNKNGGFLINPNVKDLKKVLNKVMSWSKSEQLEHGEKLYDFVLKNYTWKQKINDWVKLYKKMSNG